MLSLIVVSLLWAFSFGLIRRYLGGIDSAAVALLRLLLALLVFLPWLRVRGASAKQRLQLMAIGALQFGLMYLFYLEAFRDLQAYQVAVLTLVTPIFVVLFDRVLSQRPAAQPMLAAILSVVGAYVIVASRPLGRAEWRGIVLVQASNACFALGQLLYCRIRSQVRETSEAKLFVWLCLGAVMLAFPYAVGQAIHALHSLSITQLLVLLYLGCIASGLGFLLWNHGATQVGPGTLAVMNNAKIPLAVVASLLVFGEQAKLWRLALGALLIVAGLVLAECAPRSVKSRE
jgi:drug/metabolite transporter (DMT)-like permease